MQNDGSIELFDGRTFDHAEHIGIEYQNQKGPGWMIDVHPPTVSVRHSDVDMYVDYEYRDGVWYELLPLSFFLGCRWSGWWKIGAIAAAAAVGYMVFLK